MKCITARVVRVTIMVIMDTIMVIMVIIMVIVVWFREQTLSTLKRQAYPRTGHPTWEHPKF